MPFTLGLICINSFLEFFTGPEINNEIYFDDVKNDKEIGISEGIDLKTSWENLLN